jgi:outer membrane lipoprotein LolB
MAGCSGLLVDDEANLPLGPAVESFQIAGRLAIRQGPRRDHLRFDWSHSAQTDSLLLTTPLGQGVAEIQRDNQGASLLLADGKRYNAPDWRSLVLQVMETPLPLEILPEWLRGGRPERQGNIDGWHIRITDATLLPSHQRRLPRVIEAVRDDVELRLIVDDWGSD